jgi:hypothetical protein
MPIMVTIFDQSHPLGHCKPFGSSLLSFWLFGEQGHGVHFSVRFMSLLESRCVCEGDGGKLQANFLVFEYILSIQLLFVLLFFLPLVLCYRAPAGYCE